LGLFLRSRIAVLKSFFLLQRQTPNSKSGRARATLHSLDQEPCAVPCIMCRLSRLRRSRLVRHAAASTAGWEQRTIKEHSELL
jgi:hypothetical protein